MPLHNYWPFTAFTWTQTKESGNNKSPTDNNIKPGSTNVDSIHDDASDEFLRRQPPPQQTKQGQPSSSHSRKPVTTATGGTTSRILQEVDDNRPITVGKSLMKGKYTLSRATKGKSLVKGRYYIPCSTMTGTTIPSSIYNGKQKLTGKQHSISDSDSSPQHHKSGGSTSSSNRSSGCVPNNKNNNNNGQGFVQEQHENYPQSKTGPQRNSQSAFNQGVDKSNKLAPPATSSPHDNSGVASSTATAADMISGNPPTPKEENQENLPPPDSEKSNEGGNLTNGNLYSPSTIPTHEDVRAHVKAFDDVDFKDSKAVQEYISKSENIVSALKRKIEKGTEELQNGRKKLAKLSHHACTSNNNTPAADDGGASNDCFMIDTLTTDDGTPNTVLNTHFDNSGANNNSVAMPTHASPSDAGLMRINNTSINDSGTNSANATIATATDEVAPSNAGVNNTSIAETATTTNDVAVDREDRATESTNHRSDADREARSGDKPSTDHRSGDGNKDARSAADKKKNTEGSKKLKAAIKRLRDDKGELPTIRRGRTRLQCHRISDEAVNLIDEGIDLMDRLRSKHKPGVQCPEDWESGGVNEDSFTNSANAMIAAATDDAPSNAGLTSLDNSFIEGSDGANEDSDEDSDTNSTSATIRPWKDSELQWAPAKLMELPNGTYRLIDNQNFAVDVYKEWIEKNFKGADELIKTLRENKGEWVDLNEDDDDDDEPWEDKGPLGSLELLDRELQRNTAQNIPGKIKLGKCVWVSSWRGSLSSVDSYLPGRILLSAEPSLDKLDGQVRVQLENDKKNTCRVVKDWAVNERYPARRGKVLVSCTWGPKSFIKGEFEVLPPKSFIKGKVLRENFYVWISIRSGGCIYKCAGRKVQGELEDKVPYGHELVQLEHDEKNTCRLIKRKFVHYPGGCPSGKTLAYGHDREHYLYHFLEDADYIASMGTKIDFIKLGDAKQSRTRYGN